MDTSWLIIYFLIFIFIISFPSCEKPALPIILHERAYLKNSPSMQPISCHWHHYPVPSPTPPASLGLMPRARLHPCCSPALCPHCAPPFPSELLLLPLLNTFLTQLGSATPKQAAQTLDASLSWPPRTLLLICSASHMLCIWHNTLGWHCHQFPCSGVLLAPLRLHHPATSASTFITFPAPTPLSSRSLLFHKVMHPPRCKKAHVAWLHLGTLFLKHALWMILMSKPSNEFTVACWDPLGSSPSYQWHVFLHHTKGGGSCCFFAHSLSRKETQTSPFLVMSFRSGALFLLMCTPYSLVYSHQAKNKFEHIKIIITFFSKSYCL